MSLIFRLILSIAAVLLCVMSIIVQLQKRGSTDTITEMGVAIVFVGLAIAWKNNGNHS